MFHTGKRVPRGRQHIQQELIDDVAILSNLEQMVALFQCFVTVSCLHNIGNFRDLIKRIEIVTGPLRQPTGNGFQIRGHLRICVL